MQIVSQHCRKTIARFTHNNRLPANQLAKQDARFTKALAYSVQAS